MSTIDNPFPAPAASTAAVEVAQSREMVEAAAAIAVARQHPRDQHAAMQRVLDAVAHPDVAEAGLYSYQRGGSEIEDLSIRAAEIIMLEWGNMQAGVRELESQSGSTTMEAWSWDLEHNVRDSKVFTVPHERHTRNAVKHLTDPRDIYELTANFASRRKRACMLAVLPRAVRDAAVRQINLTLIEHSPADDESRDAMLRGFAKFGVSQQALEKFLGRSFDSVRPVHMARLKKIGTSLREGMSQPSDWFQGVKAAPAGGRAENITERVKAKAPAPVTESSPVETGDDGAGAALLAELEQLAAEAAETEPSRERLGELFEAAQQGGHEAAAKLAADLLAMLDE